MMNIERNRETIFQICNASATGDNICFLCPKEGCSGISIGITDGVDIWKTNLHEDQAPAKDKIRDSISKGEIHRAIDGNIITLNIGLGANVNSFKLNKVPDTERCVLLKRILFRLAEKSTDTQSKLDAANKKIETLEKSKTQDAARQNVFDTAVVGKKRKNQPVAKAPKQPGMSVINPGSKKRTAAKGVEFN